MTEKKTQTNRFSTHKMIEHNRNDRATANLLMSISKSLRVLTGKMIFVIFAHIKRTVLLLSQPKKKKKHTKIILILYSINCYVRNSKPIYLMSEQTCVPNINNVWHTNETYQQLRSA